MSHSTAIVRALTIGFDLSDRTGVCVGINSSGEVVLKDRVVLTRSGLAKSFASVDPARVVIEAGSHSSWIKVALEELGHEVIVANPRKLRLSY